MSNFKHVIIYTDGACIGNPGPGGYGIVLLYEGRRKEISAGFRKTTNNRMELLAAIVGLKALNQNCSVTLCSDSQYLVKAINLGWAKSWRNNGWRKNSKGRALNTDLWEILLNLCDQHQVEFKWVKGHNCTNENERCDELSLEAAKQSNQLVDVGYESSLKK